MGQLEFKAVKLIPKGPFGEIPTADTLFGAIGVAIAKLFGGRAVDELADAFGAGARISSAFPFRGDTYYLPKPLSVEVADLQSLFGDLPERDWYTTVKTLKKARYLDLGNFERALRLDPFEGPEDIPVETLDVPRVSLDRITNDSSLYFWRETRFGDGSGVYFLYRGDEGTFKDYILPAVRYLADTGISGKSTWGFGLFDFSVERLVLNVPESPYAVTLSNAVPSKEPLLWRVMRKGGWSFGRRKPKVNFIAEGSIVRDDQGRVLTPNLGLPHQVYVYGLTFPVPAKIPEGLP